jgi:hypothetical protein
MRGSPLARAEGGLRWRTRADYLESLKNPRMEAVWNPYG